MKPTAEIALTAVKLIHTIIWAVMATITGYILWSGITGKISIYSWLAVAVISGEGLVLFLFKGHCPLTYVARKYSDIQRYNFDIYLPEWLARYNKEIFTTIAYTGLLLMLYHIVPGAIVWAIAGLLLLLILAGACHAGNA